MHGSGGYWARSKGRLLWWHRTHNHWCDCKHTQYLQPIQNHLMMALPRTRFCPAVNISKDKIKSLYVSFHAAKKFTCAFAGFRTPPANIVHIEKKIYQHMLIIRIADQHEETLSWNVGTWNEEQKQKNKLGNRKGKCCFRHCFCTVEKSFQFLCERWNQEAGSYL